MAVRFIDGTLALEVVGAFIAAVIVARVASHALAAIACRVLDRGSRGSDPRTRQQRSDAARHLRGPLAFGLALACGSSR